MRRTRLKFAMNIIRLILLVVSLVALVVFLLWAYYPSHIKSLDAALLSRYTSSFERELNQAEVALRSNPAQGIDALEAFLNKNQSIMKQDRVYPLKTKAFSLLTTALLKEKRTQDAIKRFDDWIEFNPRDLNAQLGRAWVLRRDPATLKEGVEVAERYYSMAPESDLISFRYLQMLVEQRRMVEAFLVDFSRSGIDRSLHWDIFWDTGSGFNGAQSAKVLPTYDGDGNITINATLPSGLKAVRLDLPPGNRIRISSPVFSMTAPGASLQLPLYRSRLQMNQLLTEGNDLLSSGGNDPYFTWQIPQGGPSAVTWKVQFSSGISPYSGFDLFRYLSGPEEARLIEKRFLEEGRVEAAREFSKRLEHYMKKRSVR